MDRRLDPRQLEKIKAGSACVQRLGEGEATLLAGLVVAVYLPTGMPPNLKQLHVGEGPS